MRSESFSPTQVFVLSKLRSSSGSSDANPFFLLFWACLYPVESHLRSFGAHIHKHTCNCILSSELTTACKCVGVALFCRDNLPVLADTFERHKVQCWRCRWKYSHIQLQPRLCIVWTFGSSVWAQWNLERDSTQVLRWVLYNFSQAYEHLRCQTFL